MDLNQLYFDHQVLQMKADRAPARYLRREHRFGAAVIASRIGRGQRILGAAAARSWEALAFNDTCLAARWGDPEKAL